MDPTALVGLLNQSFRMWCVPAVAEPGRKGGQWARVRPTAGGCIGVSRDSGRSAGWRVHGLRAEANPVELASIRFLLRRLRLELDPGYVPRRAIVGVRPIEPRAS